MRKHKSFANIDPQKMLKTELSIGKRHLVNNKPLRRFPTTYLESFLIEWPSGGKVIEG